MAIKPDEYLTRHLNAVDQLTDRLVTLGVTTAKNAAKAHEHSHRAHEAARLSARYSDHVEAEAVRIGETLATREELTIGAVAESLSALPDPHLADIALAKTWNMHVTAARDLAFSNVAAAPAKLSEAFDRVSDETLSVAAKLGDVDTAQAALDAGLADEWQHLTALIREHDALARLRSDLRSYGLIAAPYGADTGWQWGYRQEPSASAMKRGNERKPFDGGRALAIANAKARPYCPASRAEAKPRSTDLYLSGG
ncbi:hypothetical protein GCM10027169_15740 [Gordonia jinhuaensis]|uniref:Uncharacterized protein n=1 Tax=Gordonia jinhuaensis TaxID=1517702 RepID=A0A916X1V4_9ACTN|nr:hypothetical protein [Gordonia jinhuaensis]GGB49066.1 hypothetical protein GCM10011489_40040 [Gordonia jinhuaensis]